MVKARRWAILNIILGQGIRGAGIHFYLGQQLKNTFRQQAAS